jgi:hypothetical protein
MSEQPITPAEAQQAAGEQLAAQAEQAAAVPLDAGPTLEQIQQAQREAVLPYERALQQALDQMSQLSEQVKDLQAGVAAAQQAAGPPAVEQYANGVAALVKAHADANPDLGPGHFAGALKAAGELKTAATEAVNTRDVSKMSELAAEVETWAKNFRGKHLDMSALLADLELLTGAAAKLGRDTHPAQAKAPATGGGLFPSVAHA